MRILMICTEKLPVPPIRGGAIQTYISGIAPHLAQKHDLTILGISDPELRNLETKDKVRYVRIEGNFFDVYTKGIIKFLRENENKFDVIHIFNRPLLVLPIRKVAPKARIFLSMHNDMFEPLKIEAKEAEKVISEVEGITTVSNYIGQRIRTLFPSAASKLRTVYSGVDLDRFIPYERSNAARKIREMLQKKYKLGSRKVILFIGRISPKKGVDVLIRAMSELKKRHPDVALIVVGSRWYSDEKISDYTAYVRALAAKSPVPIISTGYIPAEKIHEWFWVGDVFVCASQWEEPLARVHYEAMASGMPFVTTKRGGNAEIIQDNNGLLVEKPADPKAIAAKISKLLDNKALRQQMGRNGRAMAEKKYGWKRVASDVLKAWKG
ncbi:glycosyltransferase family 4 protein [Paenibacillus sedimenti]|uniref:Glycosyltransferase family 4 protein n=1 Tax=Paenibacillus sedimenti TaxID=2770274 RepID=A0A926KPL0_9BACL|nr:glycosyltransferase family 4 protein [Paenibacillus sedimenti]MBD0381555.1 glycosyltransferase family 4 protein [Paenibacillus sedimenti]